MMSLSIKRFSLTVMLGMSLLASTTVFASEINDDADFAEALRQSQIQYNYEQAKRALEEQHYAQREQHALERALLESAHEQSALRAQPLAPAPAQAAVSSLLPAPEPMAPTFSAQITEDDAELDAAIRLSLLDLQDQPRSAQASSSSSAVSIGSRNNVEGLNLTPQQMQRRQAIFNDPYWMNTSQTLLDEFELSATASLDQIKNRYALILTALNEAPLGWLNTEEDRCAKQWQLSLNYIAESKLQDWLRDARRQHQNRNIPFGLTSEFMESQRKTFKELTRRTLSQDVKSFYNQLLELKVLGFLDRLAAVSHAVPQNANPGRVGAASSALPQVSSSSSSTAVRAAAEDEDLDLSAEQKQKRIKLKNDPQTKVMFDRWLMYFGLKRGAKIGEVQRAVQIMNWALNGNSGYGITAAERSMFESFKGRIQREGLSNMRDQMLSTYEHLEELDELYLFDHFSGVNAGSSSSSSSNRS
ncbi:MAG: hypothetical protein ACK5O7_03570 [Holosporales bacterium]